MLVLPGAEVSKAGLAFGLLGCCTAGRRSAFILSSWAFSERREPQCEHMRTSTISCFCFVHRCLVSRRLWVFFFPDLFLLLYSCFFFFFFTFFFHKSIVFVNNVVYAFVHPNLSFFFLFLLKVEEVKNVRFSFCGQTRLYIHPHETVLTVSVFQSDINMNPSITWLYECI